MASLHQDEESQLLVDHLQEVEQLLEQEEDELLFSHTVDVEDELSMMQHLDNVEQELEDDMSLLEHLEETEEDLALVSHMDDIDQQAEQQGGAVVPAYYLKRVVRQRARRFRANAVKFNAQFNPVWLQQQRLEELLQGLREQFDAIIRELRLDVNGQTNDRIGLALHHPGLNVPIRIPFRRLHELHGEDIMAMVETVHHNNDNARIDAAMDIEFLHVEDPDRLGEGRGHRSKHSPKNLATFLEKKQCIVRRKNQDDLCFARAVVVGLHYAKKPVPFQRLEPNCKAWDPRRTALTRTNRADVKKEEAIKIFREIGIEPGPCSGRETWTVFSEYLAPEYQLKVYSQDV
ncbi:uncharacterized protein LOC124258101 [Haliotis rubra]|uniref:uncharacterized protein LOC124258101 n=1 Tax=Haliotis rubra TaxID=36100 RepID=UPI001EE5CA64|nr:uncharacterized protein LOC124258101 [Haliotis rubra]